MKENILVDLSMQFSINIVKLCENIKGHYSIVNQLERSSTLFELLNTLIVDLKK